MDNTGNIEHNMLLYTPFHSNNDVVGNELNNNITNKGIVDYESNEFSTLMSKLFIILLCAVGMVLGIYLCVLLYNKYKRKTILETADLVDIVDLKGI